MYVIYAVLCLDFFSFNDCNDAKGQWLSFHINRVSRFVFNLGALSILRHYSLSTNSSLLRFQCVVMWYYRTMPQLSKRKGEVRILSSKQSLIPFGAPLETHFRLPLGTPFGMSFKAPFGMSFKTEFRTPFGTPFRTPFGTPLWTPFGTPFRTLLWTPFGMSFKTSFSMPFKMQFKTPFGTPFRTLFGTPLWTPHWTPFRTPFWTLFVSLLGTPFGMSFKTLFETPFGMPFETLCIFANPSPIPSPLCHVFRSYTFFVLYIFLET